MVDLTSGVITEPTNFSQPSETVYNTFHYGCSATYNGEIFYFGGSRPNHQIGETTSVSYLSLEPKLLYNLFHYTKSSSK